MSERRTGYGYAIAAYAAWGVFPLYWRLMRPSSPMEILAQRIVWCVVLMLVVAAVGRTWRRLRVSLRPRTLGLIGAASVALAVNWGTYIYAVNTDRVVESSLGYFINPLVTVLLGVLVLHERLSAGQWVAMGIAAAAVGVLTIDYGHPPYFALVLAFSFGLYGLIKNRLRVPAADGLTAEAGLLALPAAGYLVFLEVQGQATLGHVSLGHTLLVVTSGAVTSGPLLLFAGAAKRLPLSAIGLLQYIAPILQLAVGVLVIHEPMPPARLAGFGLVWAALAVFSVDGILRARTATRMKNIDQIPTVSIGSAPAP